MAAPVAALKVGYNFRDAKGFVRRIRVILGDATNSAILTDSANGTTLLQAVSNAHVYSTLDAHKSILTLGTAATYLDCEDKAALTFVDPQGGFHRYQIPAPKSAGFLADQETVNAAETNMSALIGWFQSFVFGAQTDTSALVYVGGTRLRRKQSRKFNVITRDPGLANPGE